MNIEIRQFTVVCLCLLVGGAWSSGPDYGSNAKIRCDGTSFYKQTKITYPSQRNDCSYTFKAHSWFVCQVCIRYQNRKQISVNFRVFIPTNMSSNFPHSKAASHHLQSGNYVPIIFDSLDSVLEYNFQTNFHILLSP